MWLYYSLVDLNREHLSDLIDVDESEMSKLEDSELKEIEYRKKMTIRDWDKFMDVTDLEENALEDSFFALGNKSLRRQPDFHHLLPCQFTAIFNWLMK